MALDFPSSPSDGQTYTSGGKTWIYDATSTTWNAQPVSSAIFTNIDSGLETPDYIDFDTGATVTRETGRLWWDNEDGTSTLNLGMAGSDVTQQIGEEIYFRIKASSAIAEGDVVMFTGTVGASGALTGAPATGLTKSTASYVMGVATEAIALNEWGYVTQFGVVRGVDTSAFSDGDILYLDTSVAGGLTATVPSAPAPKVEVAAVIYAASNGSLFVRPIARFELEQLNDVETAGASNDDLLQYNGTSGVWEHSPASGITVGNVSGTVAVANGGTGATDAATALTNLGAYAASNPSGYTSNTGTVTSVEATVPTGFSITGSPITTSGTIAISFSAGYSLPTDASQTNWDTAYGWGNHATAGYQMAATALTTSTTFSGDVSGTYDAIVVADDSHNHIISNVDGLQTALDGKQSTLSGLAVTSTTVAGTDKVLIQDISDSDNLKYVTAQSIADLAGGGSGTVTSVSGTGTVNGLSLTGTVTTSGSLTLGGTLAISNADWSGTDLSVANGGTGTSSLTSGYLVKGNGTSAVTASVLYDDGTNAGIGTTSPASELHINNTSTNSIFTITSADSSTAAIMFGDQSSSTIGSIYYNNSNDAMYFRTNGNTSAFINSSGNVGIGTTSPGYRLDISAADTTANVGYAMRLRSNATAGAATLQFTNSAVTTQNGYITSTDAGGLIVNGSSYFAANVNGTDRMRIDSSGNVGIGLTSLSSGYVGGGPPALNIKNGGSVLWPNASGTWNTTTAGAALTYFTDNNLYIDAKDSTSKMIFRVGSDTERMRINSSGSVGIGTTSPSEKLHVVGATKATNFVETVYTFVGGVLTASNGGIHTWTLTNNSTLTVSMAAGESVLLMIDDGAGYAVTWPTMTWVGGSAPTLATSGYTVVELWKVGSTLYGAYVGDVA